MLERTHSGLCASWIVATLAMLGPSCAKSNPDFVGQTGETSTDSVADTEPTSTTTGTTSTGTTTMGTQDCAPVLSSLRLTVFAENCTSADCHSGDAPAGALDLVDVDLFEDLLDVRSSTCLDWTRVVAESPEQSVLYAKVAGLATCEVKDPVDHAPLPEAELQCIAQWIESIASCERCGGTECLNLEADPVNCGECGQICPPGVSCVGGTCDCAGGALACDQQCIDPMTDGQHCGGCGNDCQGSACESGECACVGLTLCDGCVDTDTDPLHCGGCNQPCGPGRGCSQGSCDCTETMVSFSADVQPLFTAHCSKNGCHGGNMPKEDLSLEQGNAYANLVGVETVQCADGRLLVDPGYPDDSYLMHKLLGVEICAGVQMPSSGGPSAGIDAAGIDVIAAWICQGALEN
jgi:hypothetical protein